MNFRCIFLCISAFFLIHTLVLVCMFHDKIIHLKLLLSSTSISISTHVSGDVGDQQSILEELEKMWQEKLIGDLFRGTATSNIEETLDQETGPTTEFARIHTITPQLLDFNDKHGDELAGQQIGQSVLKDLMPKIEPVEDNDEFSSQEVIILPTTHQPKMIQSAEHIPDEDDDYNEFSTEEVTHQPKMIQPAEHISNEDEDYNEFSTKEITHQPKMIQPAEHILGEDEDYNEFSTKEVTHQPKMIQPAELIPGEDEDYNEFSTRKVADEVSEDSITLKQEEEPNTGRVVTVPQDDDEEDNPFLTVARAATSIVDIEQQDNIPYDQVRKQNIEQVEEPEKPDDVEIPEVADQQQLHVKSEETELQLANHEPTLKDVPEQVPLRSVAIENIEAPDDGPATPRPKQPKMVLVLTQSRHGSTWLMDILGNRDEAVPVFEPLNTQPFLKMYALSDEIRAETLAAGYDPEIYKDWREVYLARICLCDWHGVLIPGKKDKHFQSVMGLGYKAKRLGTEYKMQYKESMAKCQEEKTMMVPKTIRYYNISTMYKVQDFGCDNFKVVHLVRDPRAVLKSRMSVFHELYDGNKYLGAHISDKEGQAGFSEEYMTEAAHWMCSHHLYNYKLGMNPPPWLKGRYKMVRFEDLAESPQQVTRDLLHFIGVKYTAKYQEYVYNLTHVKDRGGKDGGYFGVERQSSEILDAWKKKLSEPHWRTIEKVCADMMKAFNYEPTFF